MVERSNNYVFEDDMTPTAQGEGLQVMNLAHCLHIVLAIGNYEYIFGEWGGFSGRGAYVEISFHGGVFVGEWNFPRSESWIFRH